MKKILVMGSQGAGKSTMAKKMAQRSGIPVFHLDNVYWETWGPAGLEPSIEEIRDKIREITDGESWIIDGNYMNTLDLRLPITDAVVLLDISRIICLFRVIKRRIITALTHHYKEELGPHQKISWRFLMAVWNYRTRLRPNIIKALEHSDTPVFNLATTKQATKFIDKFEFLTTELTR